MTYKPEPIDTSAVTLTAEYLKLAELLAQNIHEIWARHYFDEGWRYGSQYNPTLKHVPYLIPYYELPESERQTRRLAVIETLKTLLALGYRVESSELVNASVHSLNDRNLSSMLQGLKASSELTLTTLLEIRRETVRLHPQVPDIYQVLADSFIRLGEPLIAYDVLAEGLKYFPEDLKLKQLLALALARSGATVAANTLLLQLVQAGEQDDETLGLLARTHKDLWLQATDRDMHDQQLRYAFERYQQAYRLSWGTWAGINAATLAMVRGEYEPAQAIAQQVRESCLQKLPTTSDRSATDYWTLATLGEAALLLGHWSEAEDWYGQAVEVGQGRFGDLSSTRRNALLLANYLKIDSQQVKRWFQIPRVVVFCGHMVDQPSRLGARFPEHLEPRVYEAIYHRLHQLDARLGYASAACGADILFLEAIRELKGELHIVLPYEREQFVQDSVDIIPGANWKERFEQLTQQATEVIIASNQKLQESHVVYEYSSHLLHGMAKMRAEQLGTELVPMAVWDGKQGNGLGGTASTIAFWQRWSDNSDNIEVIDLASLLEQTPVTLPASAPHAPSLPPFAASAAPAEQEIRALLFGDVVNYSQLREEQYQSFTQHFLQAIASLAEDSASQPLLQNTWGDALYFVFATTAAAGEFALDVCELVQTINWQEKNLPPELSLRIALHAGPVQRHVDPITRQDNYIGTHVTRTARIEPITPPGKVYASQAFAAIAASEALKSFTCDYVGQIPWAKRYGTFPTYHVRRSLSIVPGGL